jgi:hypothetical protein
MGCPKLPTLTKRIKELWPEYRVTCEPETVDTDRKYPGSRLRWPGKGRPGYDLRVRKKAPTIKDEYHEETIFEHHSGETYRTNQEVVDWIKKHKKETSHAPKRSLGAPGGEGDAADARRERL